MGSSGFWILVFFLVEFLSNLVFVDVISTFHDFIFIQFYLVRSLMLLGLIRDLKENQLIGSLPIELGI